MRIIIILFISVLLFITGCASQIPPADNQTTNKTVSGILSDKEIPKTVLDKYEEVKSFYGKNSSLSICPPFTAGSYSGGYLVQGISDFDESTYYYNKNGKLLIGSPGSQMQCSTCRIVEEPSVPFIIEGCTLLNR